MDKSLFEVVFATLETVAPVGFDDLPAIATATGDDRVDADAVRFALDTLVKSGHVFRNEGARQFIVNPMPPCPVSEVRATEPEQQQPPDPVIRRGSDWRENNNKNFYCFVGNTRALVFKNKRGAWKYQFTTTEWGEESFPSPEAAMMEAQARLLAMKEAE